MRIGDYVTFQNGYAFESKDFCSDGNMRVIKIKELKDGEIKFFDDSAKVNLDEEGDLQKYIVRKGDVLFALTGDPVNKNNPLSWVGRVSIYNFDFPAVLNQRVCKMVSLDDNITNLKYLYYHFRSFENFYSLASKATGSASQANISVNTIASEEIEMPDIGVQDKIVQILDAITNKIYVNNAINDNLAA